MNPVKIFETKDIDEGNEASGENRTDREMKRKGKRLGRGSEREITKEISVSVAGR